MTREEFVQKHLAELVGRIVFGINSALCDGPTVRANKILKEARDMEAFLAGCYDELRPAQPLPVKGANGVARRTGA